MNTNTYEHPGSIIWQQITVPTKMACGVRHVVRDDGGDFHLRFQVGGGQKRYIEVHLDNDDTYTVRLVRYKRGTYERIVMRELSTVYVDSLNEVIYSFVNK